MKFRKKPVVIEAFQMTSERMKIDSEWPEWLCEAWDKEDDDEGAVWADANGMFVSTLEGSHRVSINDWIIRGVQGELYPCKPDIFDATYDPVSEAVGR